MMNCTRVFVFVTLGVVWLTVDNRRRLRGGRELPGRRGGERKTRAEEHRTPYGRYEHQN